MIKDIGITIVFMIAVSVSYIEGMKSERFDRKHANMKYQQCLDVIKQSSTPKKVCK